MAALNLIDDNAKQPLPYELWRAIEDLFLEKRPYKTSSNSYTLVPRAAADIKRRLFEIVETDPKRSRTASNLLAQIEEWRLRYGRPAFNRGIRYSTPEASGRRIRKIRADSSLLG